MEIAHLGSGNRICTVVFVDIVQYSQEPVSRQAEMRTCFTGLLGRALEDTPPADRLVLDTGDGAALCFLGDPADALFAANSLRSQVVEAGGETGLRLRLGINLGPVRVVKDINGRANVIGDGINVAQRVMSFAAPNQILVSRSYFEVVSRLAAEYGQLFQYVGLHRDKHVRDHEVYEVQLSSTTGSPGPSVDAAPPPGARFDPALLARLTAALAREIGPVAKVVVGRAAERAADHEALVEALAGGVPEGSRAAFLASVRGLVRAAAAPAKPERTGTPGAEGGSPGAASGSPGAASGSPGAASPREIDSALIARVERLLTGQIGPVARILVREAARRAASPRDLFESVAIHIASEEARRSFVAEADRGG
ncbi:MAG TPA: adenylate/guanylate cyclase domain-containing protein [Candidatus Binatia bacterium]|nr:adenylate/guanylate cyclase domain-containing protein [Candidatus Binatia bacterium]